MAGLHLALGDALAFSLVHDERHLRATADPLRATRWGQGEHPGSASCPIVVTAYSMQLNMVVSELSIHTGELDERSER